MRYVYSGLIPQNIAPKGATKIGVYNANGVRVAEIPLGRLTPPNKNKLYSFGLVSDLHLTAERTETSTHLDKAFTYFESQGCLFCAHAGDMTNIGFWYDRGDTEIYLGQFAEYKRICDLHPNLPVYGICGNHENYNKYITENLTELEEYTGHGLYYTIRQGNDLFIFIGQPVPYETINKTELQWLYETLEANRNIRSHIFLHVFPPNDSGNPKNCYAEAVFGGYANIVKNLLNHYKNAILYHGHSHIKFEYQELDETTNFTEKNGYPSVHIPSVSHSMDVVLQSDGSYKRVADYRSSQGYIVDVYEDCIVFNGIEFNGGKVEALGTLKIDTTLQTIEANTFTDNTGTITT